MAGARRHPTGLPLPADELGQVGGDDVGPVGGEPLARPAAVDAHDEAEAQRAAGWTPAIASSKTAASAGLTDSSPAALRKVSGAGLPRSDSSAASTPVTAASNSS